MFGVKKADLINVYMFVLGDIKKNNKQSNVVLAGEDGDGVRSQ